MKVIDIMQKVANGEIFEFKIGSEKYYVDSDHNICESDGYKWYIYSEWLNTEVEIIEDKKIEKVNTYVLCDSDFSSKGEYSLKATEIIDKAFEEYSHKINEIIDYLEENK